MRRTRRGACAGAWLVLALAGCRSERAPEPRRDETPGRARVLAFWERFHAATARRTAKDCAGAVELYRQALELDPAHEDSLYYLGQCLRDLRHAVEARRAFERLVEINPSSSRAHMALGALLASPEAFEPLDLGAAERCFRRAHEINAEETGPIVRLAEVLIVTGRRGEARELLEAAVRTNAKSVEAAFLAGYLAWQRGDAHGARAFAERTFEAAQHDAPVRGVLGEGDRRAGGGAPPPPLENPMGRMLFGKAVAEGVAAAKTPADVEPAWRALERAEADFARRAGSGEQS